MASQSELQHGQVLNDDLQGMQASPGTQTHSVTTMRRTGNKFILTLILQGTKQATNCVACYMVAMQGCAAHVHQPCV